MIDLIGYWRQRNAGLIAPKFISSRSVFKLLCKFNFDSVTVFLHIKLLTHFQKICQLLSFCKFVLHSDNKM